MSNPFLFDDDGDAGNEPAANPFLLEDTSATETEAFAEDANDNPFLAQASNPFAFDAEDDVQPESVPEPAAVAVAVAVAPTSDVEDKAMSFFGTTITDDDEAEVVNVQHTATASESNEDLKKPPPPRPTPPQATQDLISSVADHLDQTSSHLLDRIPKTRTPSPVSMRDLHSPSPTPEMANLLMTDVLETADDGLRSDNPFADLDDEPAPVIQPKPTRPVPPRPCPPPLQPEVESKSEPEADLFDFGTTATVPKPQVPKSNQDIMSLFSPPKAAEPQKPDLMMDEPIQASQQILPIQQIIPPVVQNARPPVPPPPQRANITPPQPKPTPMVQSEPIPEVIPQSITSVPSVENIPHIEESAAVEPVESAPISSITINDEPYNSTIQDNGFLDAERSDTISDNSSAVESLIRTPGVSTPFYTGGPDAQILDRSQSPVSKEEMINSYINDTSSVSPPAASNPFGSPEAVVPPPVRPRPPMVVKKNDSFDAFAAKFDSVKKEDNSLLDGFGGTSSGYKSPAVADGMFHNRIGII